MNPSDTYQRLLREAFKDMTLEQEKDFLVWALELYLKTTQKVLNEKKSITSNV